MKQIKIMTAVFTVLMLLALGAGILFLNSTGYRGRDVSRAIGFFWWQVLRFRVKMAPWRKISY